MFKDLWEFMEHPFFTEDQNKDFKHRISIFYKFLGLSLAISLVLGFMASFFQAVFGLDFGAHAIDQALDKYPPIYLLLMAVTLGPIIEETIFRGPFYFFRNSKYFHFIFYALTLIFGFYHITNFEITGTILLFSPLLVAPQLSAGVFFGYIRIRFGLVWSMALHAFYNLILVGPLILLKVLDISLK